MTQRAGQRRAPEGRHRSPWGRSGRIMPIRWGRIVAVVAVFVVAIGGLVLVRWGTRGASEPAGHDGRIAAPMSVTASPDPATAPGADPATAPRGEPTPLAAGQAGVAAAEGLPAPVPTGPAPQVDRGLASSGSARPPGTVTGPAGPALRLSRSAVDFGDSITSDAVELRNQGRAPVQFAVGPVPGWLEVTPGGGRLDAGTSATLAIMIDRAAAPVGVVRADVRVSAVNGTGGGTVRVRASVSGPPKVVSVIATPKIVRLGSCPASAGPTVSNVQVVAEDSTGIRSVGVVARMPDGRSAAKQLALDGATGNRSTWSGVIGPAGVAGRVSFTVTVTDFDGLKAEAQDSLVVEGCSG